MDTVLRITIVYVVLMLGFRVLGKRELSKLSPFELVTLLVIPEIFTPALTGDDHSMTGAVVGVATLWTLTFLNSLLGYRTRVFRHLNESPPTVLVRHGRLVERNLHRERMRPDEILSEMRLNGIAELAQVRWAILEPGGTVSFVRADGGATRADRDGGVV